MPSSFPTLGILGGGQLGKMTAMAAIQLGLNVRLLSPKEAGPMAQVGTAIVDDWTDLDVLERFARPCDVITVESEWAPADLMSEVLPDSAALWPHPDTVATIRDKGLQKTVLAQAQLPIPDFRRCETLDDALDAADELGYPVLLKQYRGSYDGYGNATAMTGDDVKARWPALASDKGLLVEEFISFNRELAVLVARSPDGEHVIYPVVHTEQVDHRLYTLSAPPTISHSVVEEVHRVARAAIEAVNGVGITAVELFEMEDGAVLINELAPRPHNTGHYTIEACHTSQFENHVRAVLGLPLGDPSLRVPAVAMTNILGHRDGQARPEGLPEALSIQGAAIHIYGKPDVRPNRKMGHVTVTGADTSSARKRAQEAAGFIFL